MDSSYSNRFSGIGRLYGKDGLAALSRSHIAVIGVGGVGSWTVEALVRSGVGELTLIDLDSVCITNTNRQLHAISSQIGKDKVEVMAERARAINPSVLIHEQLDFFTESTADELLAGGYDCVVDAIDSIKHKSYLIASCRDRGIPIVVCGGAGGKMDPTAVRSADLAFATNDRLLKILRKRLRDEFGFPPQPLKQAFKMPAVFSVENAKYPWSNGTVCAVPEPGSTLRLDCQSGFGTATQVTGAFGFAAASQAIQLVLANK